MPASQTAVQPDSESDLKEALNSFHCPYCGHTSLHHDDDHTGCTECTCHASWRDVVAINVSLLHI